MALTPSQLKKLRHTPLSSTGNRVQAALDLMGMSQVKLSKQLNFPQSYVADIARGRYADIGMRNAHKFAAFFGCRVEDLWPAEAYEAMAS